MPTLGETAGNKMPPLNFRPFSLTATIIFLQVRGIGTALKILFNDVQKLKLRRTEIVALFNALGRWVYILKCWHNKHLNYSIKTVTIVMITM